MSLICSRCALRIQRASQAETQHVAKRAFSSTPTQRRGIPEFSETSSPELDSILSTIRTKHFVPGYLDPPTRRLIFSQKGRQVLADNPQTVEIGDEEFDLEWMERTALPNRTKLFNRALSLMETKQDWSNLPKILVALNQLRGDGRSTPRANVWNMILRKAVRAGQMPVLVQCLQRSKTTGMTLKTREVLRYVMFGLRDHAARDGWSEESVKEALGMARSVANLMESEEHGTGKWVHSFDPRRKPEVLAVFLELAAVNAHLHQGGEDRGDVVKAYTARLMSCMTKGRKQPSGLQPSASGPVWEMLEGVSMWHGLALAQKVLGSEVPQAKEVAEIAAAYEAGMENLCKTIEAQKPKEGSYGDQAVRVWRDCVSY